MKKKQSQAKIPQEIDDAFAVQAVHHATKREKWVVVAAAYLMFLDAHPDRQGEFIQRVRQLENDEHVRLAVEAVLASQAAAVIEAEGEKARPKRHASGRHKKVNGRG